MRQSWTDDRLDDLSARMGQRFDRVEADVRELRTELGATRKELKVEIKELKAEIGGVKDSLEGKIDDTKDSLHNEFHALQRTMIQVAVGFFAASLGFMVTIIGVITQL